MKKSLKRKNVGILIMILYISLSIITAFWLQEHYGSGIAPPLTTPTNQLATIPTPTPNDQLNGRWGYWNLNQWIKAQPSNPEP